MSQFQLVVTTGFSGAHFLRGYEGSCARLHGHNFRVEARVSGDELSEIGMLMDFKTIKRELKSILDVFDHQVTNDIPPFDTLNPTAENVARYMHQKLSQVIEDSGARLDSVGVWETEGYGAIYTPGV